MTETGYGCKSSGLNGTTDAVSMMSYGFDPYLLQAESVSWSDLCSGRAGLRRS